MAHSRKDEIWDKAKKVRGEDPCCYRKDIYGNIMYYHSYGRNSAMGWEVDHSKPVSKGGTEHLNNLQAMNTKANRQKSDKY